MTEEIIWLLCDDSVFLFWLYDDCLQSPKAPCFLCFGLENTLDKKKKIKNQLGSRPNVTGATTDKLITDLGSEVI